MTLSLRILGSPWTRGTLGKKKKDQKKKTKRSEKGEEKNNCTFGRCEKRLWRGGGRGSSIVERNLYGRKKEGTYGLHPQDPTWVMGDPPFKRNYPGKGERWPKGNVKASSGSEIRLKGKKRKKKRVARKRVLH